MMKILLTEDDGAIALGLEYSLRQEGFSVRTCSTCGEALAALAEEPFGLLLLDLSLPDGSGYDVCRAAKAAGDLPVIFLTACDDEVNVVMGLDMGADDYITKPFRIRELVSRIRSVLRRYGKAEAAPGQLQVGPVTIQPAQAKVLKDGREILLTALEYRLLLTLASRAGEFRLLAYLMENKNRTLTRNALLSRLWDDEGDYVNDNTLTVYIKRLREKLEDDPANPAIIKTVRGLGYKAGDARA